VLATFGNKSVKFHGKKIHKFTKKLGGGATFLTHTVYINMAINWRKNQYSAL